MITEVAKNIFQIHVTLPNNPLKEHHKLRLAETYRIVQGHPGLCPYEIAGLVNDIWRYRV